MLLLLGGVVVFALLLPAFAHRARGAAAGALGRAELAFARGHNQYGQ